MTTPAKAVTSSNGDGAQAPPRHQVEDEALREAEGQDRKEAEEKARRDAEKVQREADEQALREAEGQARKEAEEKARRDAERVQREAEVQARREVECRIKKEAEEKARRDAEARSQEAEDLARKQLELLTVAASDTEADVEEDQQYAALLQAVQSGSGHRNRIGRDLNDLLAQRLSVTLLELCPRVDLYARNGFRLLGVPANIGNEQLQKLSNGHQQGRGPRDNRLWRSVGAGYGQSVSAEDVDECIRDLRDPRKRMANELFWPHLPDSVFDVIRTTGNIASPRVIRLLRDYSQIKQGGTGILAKHAEAVAYHNRAIATECVFAMGYAVNSVEFWHEALKLWRDVIESEDFWHYIAERAAVWQGRGNDAVACVERIRAELPRVLLSVNAAFARAYGDAGDDVASYRHLSYASVFHGRAAAGGSGDILVATVEAIYW